MATKVVNPRGFFPVGTGVKLYPWVANEVPLREHRSPNIAATDTGTIGSTGAVTVTANAGLYALAGTVNEVQQVTVDATAGQFKLVYAGQTSGNIAFDATAAAVDTALEALSNIGVADVSVTGGPGDEGGTTPYFVTFGTALGGTDVAEMTVAAGGTPLSGGGAVGTVTTTTGGSGGTVGSTKYMTVTVD